MNFQGEGTEGGGGTLENSGNPHAQRKLDSAARILIIF